MDYLKQFQSEIEQISGVLRATEKVYDGVTFLQVAFQGEPADYARKIEQLKRDYGIEQVERPDTSFSKRTADRMPILYYREE